MIRACGPQVEKSGSKEDQFYSGMKWEWNLHNPSKMVLGLGDFIGYLESRIDGFDSVHGGNKIGERNVEGRLLEFYDEKELSIIL